MKITSSVATVRAPGDLAFESETLDTSDLQPDELLCETLVTAISPGTELAAYRGAPALRAEVTYPRLVGYCNVARVLAAGGAPIGAYGTGDRVLSFASHRSHFVLAARDVLARVPGDVSSEAACCAYLFHLGYNAVLSGDVRLGSPVVVLGLGVAGLCTVAMAALAGARVVGVSDHARARECANDFGAVACFGRAALHTAAASVGGSGAEIVVTTSNSWADWRAALELAGVRGRIVVLGFPGRTEPAAAVNPLDSQHFYARQLRIIAAGMSPERSDARGFLPFNERDNIARILAWIASGALRPQAIVSGELPGARLVEAYASLARRDGPAFTYLLRWAR